MKPLSYYGYAIQIISDDFKKWFFFWFSTSSFRRKRIYMYKFLKSFHAPYPLLKNDTVLNFQTGTEQQQPIKSAKMDFVNGCFSFQKIIINDNK